MLRSVAAVFAGFVVLNAVAWFGGAVLAAVLPADGPASPVWAGTNLAVRMFGAFLAGLATAHVAGGARRLHAAALAVLMLLLAAISIASPMPDGLTLPRWYLPALAIVGPLAALTGGLVRARFDRGQGSGTAA